jgi:hypothetical protein
MNPSDETELAVLKKSFEDYVANSKEWRTQFDSKMERIERNIEILMFPPKVVAWIIRAIAWTVGVGSVGALASYELYQKLRGLPHQGN